MLKVIRNLLSKAIDDIDAGNSNLSEEEMINIIETINRLTVPETKYSKYQACKYLKISRSTFDNWVREGKIPEGRKEQGFTEKFWIKKDLDKVKSDQ